MLILHKKDTNWPYLGINSRILNEYVVTCKESLHFLFQTNKEVRSPCSGAIDLPVVSDGVRNIKSMWEKGNVFTSNTGTPSTNKVSSFHSHSSPLSSRIYFL